MRLVYVAHPYGGDRANLQNARRWIQWIAANFPAVAPVADWILMCELLEETEANREYGLDCDRAIVQRCDQVWMVGGRVSQGMMQEARAARIAGVSVFDLSAVGMMPPSRRLVSVDFVLWRDPNKWPNE